jgi:molybdopterin converting factor small subunit
MPKVVLASAVARRLRADGGEMSFDVAGATLADALDAVCVQHPALRGYVVDEHGRVRHHVAIFIDGAALRDKSTLDVPLAAAAEIYVLQALSGG